jgi:hypothetical protein
MTEKRPRSICPGGIEPAESAAGLMKRMVDDLTLETSGTFWHATTGEVLPW